MTFKLTDELIDDLIFCMEDQNIDYYLDSAEGAVLSFDQAEENDRIESDDLYSIPEWTSKDGFDLMESFTENLHAPMARSELRRAIENGRGVFRNFKNILKSYPEVEKLWFSYKNKVMKERVKEWYAELCETWGLEKLEESELPSDTEDLVESDFQFIEYDSSRDKDEVSRTVEFLAEENTSQFMGNLGRAVSDLTKLFSASVDFEKKKGFVCRSQAGELLGCILFSDSMSSAKNVATVTDFFVVQNFRGLGIGKELASKCISYSKKLGIQWIILTNIFISESLASLLEQFSFERLGAGGFALDLLKE